MRQHSFYQYAKSNHLSSGCCFCSQSIQLQSFMAWIQRSWLMFRPLLLEPSVKIRNSVGWGSGSPLEASLLSFQCELYFGLGVDKSLLIFSIVGRHTASSIRNRCTSPVLSPSRQVAPSAVVHQTWMLASRLFLKRCSSS